MHSSPRSTTEGSSDWIRKLKSSPDDVTCVMGVTIMTKIAEQCERESIPRDIRDGPNIHDWILQTRS